MKKAIALSGSNSSLSINKQLIQSVLQLEQAATLHWIDLNQWEFPMFSIDEEKTNGFPKSILELHEILKEAPYFLIGTNEHNRSVSAYFKNILDWLSRYDFSLFEGKTIYVLSSSTGSYGGKEANAYLNVYFTRGKAAAVLSTTFGPFDTAFDSELQQISDEKLLKEIQSQLTLLTAL